MMAQSVLLLGLRSMILATVCVASPVGAMAPPDSGLETLGQRVDDAALADMRGKFITAQQIGFFGVSLASSWQGADGITTSARLLFSVNFANGAGAPGAVPQLLISWDRNCGACGDAAMDVVGFGAAAADSFVAIVPGSGVIPVGGLDSVAGAVQSQQIAGADNNVRNDLRIAIVPMSSLSLDTSGMTPSGGGQAVDFADGDRLDFIVNGNSVGLALTQSGGPDALRQSIGDNQAAQHVLLSSSNNAVHNNMNIIVGLDGLADNGRFSLQNAMSVFHGHGL